MNLNPKAGVMLVLAAASLWGTTGTAQALAGTSLSPLWFGALRLLIASGFFALVTAVTLERGSLTHYRLSARDLVAAGVCMAVYNLAFFAGVRATGVAAGTAIALGSGPIWAGLLQSILHRRSPGAAWWGGTLTTVAGGILLTTGGQAAAQEFDRVGVVLCLISGAAYAVYTLLNKRIVSAAPTAPAALITLCAFSVAAALSVPVAWMHTGAPVIHGREAAALAYTGIVTAGVAYLLFSQALRHITPATAVTLALSEPVVAFALAATVLSERPSGLAFAGLVLIITGVGAVVRVELSSASRRSG